MNARVLLRFTMSACGLALLVCFASPSAAVSPQSIAQGKALFSQRWGARNPALGSDGLGPLFNGQACATCHNQAGVGGGGDSRFNAKFVALERVEIVGGLVDQDVITRTLRTFHPGFIRTNGFIDYTLPLTHHGGSPMYQNSRAALMSQVDSLFSNEGGSTEASEVRRGTTTPILFNNNVGGYRISLRARMFQRNTTPLFGLGLIDLVKGHLLEQHVKAQAAHPEISGRLATLSDGRYGRFGWRGKASTLLEFVDSASAEYVGLETKRVRQPRDPMMPEYRNPAVDVRDDQLRAIRDFIAALPAPSRAVAGDDSHARTVARHGEQLFASIGCAVCHVPNLAPAQGLYSDLLLHDMGGDLSDLDHAAPHIVRATPVANRFGSVTTTTQRSGMTRFARTEEELADKEFKPIPTTKSAQTRKVGGSVRNPRLNRTSPRKNIPRVQRNSSYNYFFQAPTGPTQLVRIINPRTVSKNIYSEDPITDRRETYAESSCGGGFYHTIYDTVESKSTEVTTEAYIRLVYERTNFNQEWRTPPLWGLRDSAPYMHDGRAETVLEAIALHDGEAAGTRDRFLQLSLADRHAILAFLNTLVAPHHAPQARF